MDCCRTPNIFLRRFHLASFEVFTVVLLNIRFEVPTTAFLNIRYEVLTTVLRNIRF
jgi:hypothetical protein